MTGKLKSVVNRIKESLCLRLILAIQTIIVLYLIGCCFKSPLNLIINKEQPPDNIKWDEKDNEDTHADVISNVALHGGSYDLRVIFDIEQIEEKREEYKEKTPIIFVNSKDYPLGVKAENKMFSYGDGECYARVNIDFWCNVKELNIQFDAPYNYSVSCITVVENTMYRIIRLMLVLLSFGVFDCALLYIKRLSLAGEKTKLFFFMGMGMTLLISLLPDLKFNSPVGDDYIFHLSRIYELSQELLKGTLPVRMYQGANNGYSYASPLFYCDTFLYIPALLYIIRLPLRICYNIYVVMVGVFTLYTADVLFKKIFYLENYAYRWLGTTLYMLSYYRIANIYTRSAVGEYTAMAFLPLVVIGVYGVCNHEQITKEDMLYTIIGISGIIQCHLISVEIVGAISLVYALFHIRKWFNRSNVFKVIMIGVIITGLNIWFIYPMIDSWSMNLAVFVRDESAIQKYGLYMNNLLSIINKADGSAHGIGGAILVGMFIGAFVYFYAKDIGLKRKGIFLRDALAITLGCMILSTTYFPWDTIAKWGKIIKIFTMIQFPWRYLSIATLTGAIVCTLSVYSIVEYFKGSSREYISGLVITTLMILNLVGLGYYYNDISNYTKLSSKNYIYSLDSGIRVEEYMLFPRADDIPYDILVDVVGTDMKDYSLYYEGGIEASIVNQRKHIYNIKNQSGNVDYIILPVMDYDNYHVIDMVDGRELRIVSKEVNNQYIVAEIPANYIGTVNVKYISPFSWHIAEIISLLTFFSLGIYVVMNRRKVTNNA